MPLSLSDSISPRTILSSPKPSLRVALRISMSMFVTNPKSSKGESLVGRIDLYVITIIHELLCVIRSTLHLLKVLLLFFMWRLLPQSHMISMSTTRSLFEGAKNVINACRECKVKQLIYNSSADVVFDGLHDICNGDESLPYAGKFADVLSDLKAQAEALVLLANDADGLLTCALRPSNVFGPGDTEIIPFLVNQAKSGLAKFIIGSDENMSDFTYVENVAHALICAEAALGSQLVSVSGKAFFITNLKPVKFSEFASIILEGLGYQRTMIKLPSRLVQYIVLVVKWMHAKTHSQKLNYSAPVHNVLRLALCTTTFSCSSAKKCIVYVPVISLEVNSDEYSKVEKLLGGGKGRTFTHYMILFVELSNDSILTPYNGSARGWKLH
ncbi:3beta-hydroxysteroid-dehydrogenase/decarboxylase-like isoform X2 [Actinidia eriantha]|uniref:3beta-hydroxysteroid- dehydrogenase/decarboxylase-like isoform X2 n=1 Tax=Actinidia eriantha TaxID=165200 RepID=UPI0025895502|nr:3beta-hydroxysteroid-dehydrogenase/decarboxylase-like isoform X2 [Actinidia eriantha]